MKLIYHKILSVFIIIAFLIVTSACERTVTKYDSTGKPYHDKEFSAGQTLAAILIGIITIGLLARATRSARNFNDETFNYDGKKHLTSLDSNNLINNAQKDSSYIKLIQVVDSKGNLISKQLIDLNKLSNSENIINHLDAQVSSVINEHPLLEVINNIFKGKNINSIPKSIEIEASYVPAESKLIIKTANITSKTDVRKGDSVLIFDSGRGIYRSITRENNQFNPNNYDLNQFRILLNPIS